MYFEEEIEQYQILFQIISLTPVTPQQPRPTLPVGAHGADASSWSFHFVSKDNRGFTPRLIRLRAGQSDAIIFDIMGVNSQAGNKQLKQLQVIPKAIRKSGRGPEPAESEWA